MTFQWPVVSIADYNIKRKSSSIPRKLINEFDRNLRNFGALFIVDHGVDEKLCKKCLDDFKLFFHKPTEEKLKYEVADRSRSRGYHPFETLNIRAFMGEFGYPNDAIERYLLGPTSNKEQISERGHDPRDCMIGWGPNVYHDCFKESAIEFYNETEKLCHVIMEILSLAMDEPQNFLRSLCSEDDHVMSVAHYPPVRTVKEMQDRAGEHRDISLFTVLLQDEAKGCLQMRHPSTNELIAADSPSSDAFLLVLGEPLQRMTNDFWTAISHVVPLTEQSRSIERTSIPFFVKLDKDAVIEPLPKFVAENGDYAKYETMAFLSFGTKMQNLYKK